MIGVYQHQNEGLKYICGDFSITIGVFIVAVDEIQRRKVIDFILNKYSEYFVDFLINTDMCMLNGRYDPDKYKPTSISVHEPSVVIIVWHHMKI